MQMCPRRGRGFHRCDGEVLRHTAGMDGSAWRIWLAILMLIDAAVGLLGLNTFARFLPAQRITRIAFAEGLIAIALVAWHYARL